MKQSSKPYEVDAELFVQKNYVMLFDYVQFKIVQIIFFVYIVPLIIDVENGGMVPAELFFEGSAFWSILLLGIYLFIIDFYFPKLSIAKIVFSYKVSYSNNIKLKEKVIYILLKLFDTLIAPFRIPIALLFSKVPFQLFCEKYTGVRLEKFEKNN